MSSYHEHIPGTQLLEYVTRQSAVLRRNFSFRHCFLFRLVSCYFCCCWAPYQCLFPWFLGKLHARTAKGLSSMTKCPPRSTIHSMARYPPHARTLLWTRKLTKPSTLC